MSENTDRAQFRAFVMGPGHPPSPESHGRALTGQPVIVAGLFAVSPNKKQEQLFIAKPTPTLIKRRRGFPRGSGRARPRRTGRGRLRGSGKLPELGVSPEVASNKANNSPNKNSTKRGRGRPPGTGKWQILRAQLDKPYEMALRSNSKLVQPIAQAKSAVSLKPPSESHFCDITGKLNVGTSMANAREEIIPTGPALRRCSSADTLILIDSSTDSSGFHSTCNEPLNGDGVTSTFKVKEELPDASQEHTKFNQHGNNQDADQKFASATEIKAGLHSAKSFPESGQLTATNCPQGADKCGEKWNSTALIKAIISKHGDITKSCNFQSELFKTNSLEGVCKVVKKLQETRFADVTCTLLEEFYSIIEDAESVNLEVKWLRQCVDEVAVALRSKSELQRLEKLERELRQKNKARQMAIQAKRVKVVKLQSEIDMQEEELALSLLDGEDLKAQISCIKSWYHRSDYLMESLP